MEYSAIAIDRIEWLSRLHTAGEDHGVGELESLVDALLLGSHTYEFALKLDQTRDVLRLKHYSLRTERSYCDWIERFIHFHHLRHPNEMGASEIAEFLTYLARVGDVAASTQNQALSAILFLYQQVLKQDVSWIDDVERAKKPKRIPVVLTRDEVHKVFAHLHGMSRLMVGLLYGSGLRLMECVRLRVKDVDFGYARITVRDGKGAKDRVTMLPVNMAAALERHLVKVKAQHEQDVEDGFGEVYLPDALERKYRNAARSWSWQFVFPSARISLDPRTATRRRHHVDENVLQVAVKKAVCASGISSRRHVTRCAIRLRLIFSKMATIFAPCRNC